jgi:hypothetical protein
MKIDNLPFYWRLKERGAISPVPELVPFVYDFDEGLQLLIQKREPKTLEYLKKIYKEDANIGYLQDENEIAKPYGTDFSRSVISGYKAGGSFKSGANNFLDSLTSDLGSFLTNPESYYDSEKTLVNIDKKEQFLDWGNFFKKGLKIGNISISLITIFTFEREFF